MKPIDFPVQYQTVNPKRLAVSVLTYNEERDLPQCLTSLELISADVFVFDSNSSDNTVSIARDFHANVIEFNWNGRYPKKKQWSLNFLKDNYEWVLLLDADEAITPNLASEIHEVVFSNNEISAVDVPLSYFFLGKQLKHGLRPVKRILVKPNQVEFPEIDDLGANNMWEVEGHYQPRILRGKTMRFRSKLIHRDSDTLFEYFSRHNRYSDWESFLNQDDNLANSVISARPLRARLFQSIPLKEIHIFIYSYFIKLGLLDGRIGLHFALSQSFYYWQIRIKTLECKANRNP